MGCAATTPECGQRRQVKTSRTISLFVLFVVSWSEQSLAYDHFPGWQQLANDNLGVRVITPVFATVPITTDGRKNVSVALTIWLRRIGAADGAYELPHQVKDTIRMMVWVDDPGVLQLRKYGHLWLPAEHHKWQPRISLETEAPGRALVAELETTPENLKKVPEPPLRPYSFRVEVPAGAGRCFKLIEHSHPRFKHPICLPPAAEDTLCKTLAPPFHHSKSSPALWMIIGPVRFTDSPRIWTNLTAEIAQRVKHYVTYHLAMGASGLLLYADELTRDYLRRNNQTAALLHAGTLRFVHWELKEREHADDGRGRMLGYNYDQALVAGHAFLGLSACGSNLAMLISDLDEYLYAPQPGNRWPRPYSACMPMARGGDGPIGIHTLSRIELMSSKIKPEDEPRLWLSPAAAGNGSLLANETAHPLASYDMIYRKPMKADHNKPIALPATEIVAFFVHEGIPLHSLKLHNVSIDCLVLLHVPNYFRARTTDVATYAKLDQSQFRPFHNWMIHEDGSLAPPGWAGPEAEVLVAKVAHGSRKFDTITLPLFGVGLSLMVCAALVKIMMAIRQNPHPRAPRRAADDEKGV